MAEVRSKAAGSRFRAEFKWGGCWHTVKRGSFGSYAPVGRVVTFASRKAAREAAQAMAEHFLRTRAVATPRTWGEPSPLDQSPDFQAFRGLARDLPTV